MSDTDEELRRMVRSLFKPESDETPETDTEPQENS